MNVHPNRLEKLNKRLRIAIDKNQLDHYRIVVEKSVDDLGVDLIDLASALLQITHPHLLQQATAPVEAPQTPTHSKVIQYRNVRYRLDVGSLHGIKDDELLALLVEESGVDKKRIGRLEIRDSYSLVDLPEGMPADIFQLLSETTINGQRLNIKRIKPNRKNPRGARLQQKA